MQYKGRNTKTNSLKKPTPKMSSELPFPIISLYVLVTDTQKKLKAQDINLYLNITNRLIKKQDSTVGSISDRPQYSVDRKRVC